MTSDAPATTEPTTDTLPASSPVETAPSVMLTQGAAAARVVGIVGVFMLVVGGAVIITTRAVGPRWISEGYGFLFAGLGIALMLYHAVTDGEQEIRRMYGGVAAAFLVLGLAAALVPGAFDAPSNAKHMGYYFLPWGLGAGFIALLFAVPFVRHETDDLLRNVAVDALLAIGGLLCVAVLAAGAFKPEWLAGTGLTLAILGLAYLCAYLSQVNTDEGIGYTIAFTLGAVGALALLYAFGRTVFPTVLYEGSSAFRKPSQALDSWKTAGRVLVLLACLSLVALGALGKFPVWLRAVIAGLGLLIGGVFIAGSFGAQIATPPRPYLVPGGAILGGIGLIYLAVALGVCSDNQFVTLVRRELGAYFVSPIGFIILGGMILVQWLGYVTFLEGLQSGRPVPEPIVQDYGLNILNLFAFTLQIPVLTMRLLAEEKRTGTLEVLLTIPVNEIPVVVSKFFGTWIFFLLCWIPTGMFLISLRVVGDAPFDYRPIIGFYLGLAAQGAMFVAMGLFFSSLTKDQIVSAVLTFAALLSLLFFAILRESPLILDLPEVILNVAGRLSFYHMWRESLSGQLPVRNLLLALSMMVFWLFLAMKVLETRKWK